MEKIIKNDMNPKMILKSFFGYDSFYQLQEEIVGSVLNRLDTVVIMPTGAGKSLCYQIPALIFSGLTVVISPLISLMKDQVDSLKELGISATFINSSLNFEEYNHNINLIRNGKIKLLYLAPESLIKVDIMGLLNFVKPDCFAIDEAHCISAWGHDFRPEYRQLSIIKKQFSNSVIIALTATATKIVREDIKKSLNLLNVKEFVASFNRPNLFISVIPKKDPFNQTIGFVEKFKDKSGIIYCFSRKQVDNLYENLHRLGYSVKPYHAGLSSEEREKNQELFIKDDIQIIVATIAFGMGINKPNVRFVIHYDLPKSIESYYQEIGRAGRDGLPSECILLYSSGDTIKIKYFIDQKEEEEHKKVALRHLSDMVKFAESRLCRRLLLVTYFGENYSKKNCEHCDNCTKTRENEVDLTEFAIILLDCIKNTGFKFGINHIVDILRGSNNKKILEYNHNSLKNYGSGKNLSKDQWLHIGRLLTSQNILMVDIEDYGKIKFTKKTLDVINGTYKVMGELSQDENKVIQKDDILDYDENIFDILRRKRKDIADSNNLPPYIIFHDSSLIEMAHYLPATKEQFGQITGVGNTKLEKYGDFFLLEIRNYLKNNPDKKSKEIKKEVKPTIQIRNEDAKHNITSRMFETGIPIEKIVSDFDIKYDTVIDHFYRYLQEGKCFNKDILSISKLNDDKKNKIVEAFYQLGTEKLKPIYDYFSGEIDYNELKIIRNFVLNERIKKQM